MARKLHALLGDLKDAATLTTTTSATDAAVLRATPRHPSTSPPSDASLSALLSFGRFSRLHATALVRSLSSRLELSSSSSSSSSSAVVALKSLLCLHHILSNAPFILCDALSSALSPSSGRRSPLHLSSFRDPCSPLPLSSWVRWYARLLELLISIQPLNSSNSEEISDRLSSLLSKHLIAELDRFISVIEEINRHPDLQTLEHNGLVLEVMKQVDRERMNMQRAVVFRVREVNERLAALGFADAVELACLFRRLEGCGVKWEGWELFWSEVRGVREGVERRIEEEDEAGRGRARRGERVSESARIRVRDDEAGSVRFGSSRWVKS